jgi:hypothetical protein
VILLFANFKPMIGISPFSGRTASSFATATIEDADESLTG